MIKKEKLLLVISAFFLLLAIVVYFFMEVYIPKEKEKTINEVKEITRANEELIWVSSKDLKEGTYISKENYSSCFFQDVILFDSNINGVGYSEFEKGFYLKNDIDKGFAITKSEIALSSQEIKNGNLYQIEVSNSLCNKVKNGSYVDLYVMENKKVEVVCQKKQIVNILAIKQDKYEELASSLVCFDKFVVLMYLDLDEYEQINRKEKIMMRLCYEES